MTQEEKSLLLKDLCARLPYKVKVNIKLPNHTEKIFEDHVGDLIEITKYGGYLVNSKGIDYRGLTLDILPYLRPMSSMTEEEKEFVQSSIEIVSCENYDNWYSPSAWDAMNDFVNYCDSHYLDHRGLIWRGLALEAPEGMYNIK